MSNYERVYYCLCGDNCKFETMTKEQIITAIAEATGKTPTNIDSAFITKVKEQNKGTALYFWIGTTAEYNALETKDEFCYYIKTDDTTLDDMYNAIKDIRNVVEELQGGVEEAKHDVAELQNDVAELQHNVEKNNKSINANIQGLQSNVTELQHDVAELQNDNESINTSIQSLQDGVEEAKHDVTECKLKVVGLQSNVEEVEHDIAECQNDVDKIESNTIYTVGDIFTTSNLLVLNGYVTNATREFFLFLPLSKTVDTKMIKGATLEVFNAVMRGVDGYIISDTATDFVATSAEIKCVIHENGVVLRFLNASSYETVPNNTPVAAQVNSIKLKFV